MRDENGVRLTILEQCRILKLSRATYYECCKFEAERQKKKSEENKIRLKRAKNEWSAHSTYGYKKMSKHLKRLGYDWAGEKLSRNLYKELGIKGQKPVFKTTRSGKAPYGKFPCLLQNKFIAFPNQVMATDITYIKTSWGMMYFTAVIDLYSRKILSCSCIKFVIFQTKCQTKCLDKGLCLK